MTRVLVIGLDGGTWNVIKPLVEKQELPTISSLMKEGCAGELESSIPPVTFPAWKCYSTGKNPGKLGVYWFLGVDVRKQKIEINCSRSFKSKEIWDYLSENDISCGVLNMPTTYPPKRINGFMVSRGASDYSDYTYPEYLGYLLRRKFGYRFTPQCSHEFDKDRYISEVKNLIKQKFRVARFLMKKFDPDFLHMTIFSTDTVQHFFWNYMVDKHPNYGKVIEDVWRFVDDEIGSILYYDRDEQSYTILLSDHGFTSTKCTFQMARWLIERGYLRLKTNRFSYKRVLARVGLNIAAVSPIVRRSKLFPLLRTLLPFSLQKKLYYFFPQRENVVERNPLEGLIDWNESRVIPIPQGLLYLNPKMFNSTRVYKTFRDKLMSEIKDLKDPLHGKDLAKEIYESEEIYSGPFVDYAPDIAILPAEGYEISCSATSGRKWVRSRNGWSGTHKLHGIFTIKGPDIKGGRWIHNVKIIDVAPTILHIFGLPIPKDMDGRVLETTFKCGSELAKRKPLYMEAIMERKEETEHIYSEEERKKVKERLRELGYL